MLLKLKIFVLFVIQMSFVNQLYASILRNVVLLNSLVIVIAPKLFVGSTPSSDRTEVIFLL